MAKRIKETASDKNARLAVATYYAQFCGLRGFLPQVTVAMMPSLSGWPVRNIVDGNVIAYFTTYEAAHAACVAAERTHRAA